MFLQIKTDSTLNLANSVSIYLYLVVGGAAVGVDDAAGVDAVDVDAGVDAAVDVGEIVVVVAFDADVASEHASSFVVASYAVVAAAAVGGGGDVVAVVSVRLLSFYFGESKNNWTFWI